MTKQDNITIAHKYMKVLSKINLVKRTALDTCLDAFKLCEILGERFLWNLTKPKN